MYSTSPDVGPKTSSRMIAMAVSLVGSPDPVRKAMALSTDEFEKLGAGLQDLTRAQFDQLVSIIFLEQSRLIERNRALISRIKAICHDVDTTSGS